VNDGHFLLAIRSAEEAPPFPWQSGREILDSPLGEEARPVAALKEFVGALEPKPPCDKCNTTGRVQCTLCGGEGGGKCECRDCGDVHTHKCASCKEAGYLPCPNGCKDGVIERPGVIDGNVYNLNGLAPYLAPVEAEAYRFISDGKRDSALQIGGDGWRVCAMPMRKEPTDEMPRFAIREQS
jgi:hypothetical protein